MPKDAIKRGTTLIRPPYGRPHSAVTGRPVVAYARKYRFGTRSEMYSHRAVSRSSHQTAAFCPSFPLLLVLLIALYIEHAYFSIIRGLCQLPFHIFLILYTVVCLYTSPRLKIPSPRLTEFGSICASRQKAPCLTCGTPLILGP